MTVATLRPRERRLLIIGGIAAAVVLGYMYVVEPLVARHERVRTLIASRENLLTRQQRLVARRERFVQERKALQAELTQRRARLLPGDKPPLAASELQKLVKATAEDTGVEIRSERILPTTERGGYAEVPVEVTLSGPIRSIVSFLYRLEGVPVQVSVQDLKLRVASIGAPREILATLALTGYIATGSPGEPRPSGPGRTPGA
ncbi:MAG TPA: type II secretion system protein GspM [Methylomirabilota bacterium]|jgi:type II secretory pathway component PulM|nr:type II secretion system protein GspM [Methylomirabilota bacterium]